MGQYIRGYDMPIFSLRGLPAKDQGNRVVGFRDGNGKMRSAYMIGDGSVSGIKLKWGNTIVDNVPLATTVKSTGAYFDYRV